MKKQKRTKFKWEKYNFNGTEVYKVMNEEGFILGFCNNNIKDLVKFTKILN